MSGSKHIALKRLLPPALISSTAAVFAAFLVGAALIACVGINPLTAYGALFDAALASRNGLAETLVRTVPLALCGLGIALAFRAGVFNVGAEGQLFVGGTASGLPPSAGNDAVGDGGRRTLVGSCRVAEAALSS
jgi:simple sugar transport system permease protein